jgi:hypothetical protein
MIRYNADVHTRWWHDIRRSDGRTLELEPGEKVDTADLKLLDLSNPDVFVYVPIPSDFDDPWLKPVEEKPTKRSRVEEVQSHEAV